jgi:hypothetical protein
MDEEKIKLMEQWDILLHLQNTSIERIRMVEGDVPDEEDVMGTMRMIKDFRYREQNPDTAFTLALNAELLGIDYNDIDNYLEHLDDVANEEHQAKMKTVIEQSEAWQMMAAAGYAEIAGKQYRNMYHFTFNMPDGTAVVGRTRRISWSVYEVYYKWTNAQKKRVSSRFKLEVYNNIFYGNGFPTDEQLDWGEFKDKREKFTRYVVYALLKKPRARTARARAFKDLVRPSAT